jgi:hypothetical protein
MAEAKAVMMSHIDGVLKERAQRAHHIAHDDTHRKAEKGTKGIC